MLRFFSVLFFCTSLLAAEAAISGKRFETFTPEDGLSASWVRCIYQDDIGFMWFCTNDGLNRFDGYSIKEFKPDESDSTSIISSAVTYMHPRNDGTYWICTERGVSIFDSKKETFTDFEYLNNIIVNLATTASDGKVWFATYSGAFCYNPEDKSIIQYTHKSTDPGSISSNKVRTIFQDSSGNIWLGTNDGLNLFNPGEQNFKSYFPVERDQLPGGNFVNTIIEDNRGRIWFGIENYGLILFENAHERPEYGIFTRVGKKSTFSLVIDSYNNLWNGNSNGLGMDVFDLNTFVPGEEPLIHEYASSKDDPEKMGGNSITYITEDNQAGIWFSSFANGVSYYSPLMKKFESSKILPKDLNSPVNDVVNVFLDDVQYFWIGTEEGLNRIDKTTGEHKTYLHEQENEYSLGANGILSMLKDSRGRLWVGTWMGGLHEYDYKKDIFKRYTYDSRIPNSIPTNNIFVIFEDSRGYIWLGGNEGGLSRFNPADESFKNFFPESGNENSIFHDAINDICETPDSRLLISVYHALELLDPEEGYFTHFIHDENDPGSVSSGNIIDIFIDSRENIWLATASGLNLFNIETGSFTHFHQSDGLPDNTIQAILEDESGNLWLSTNNGIAKFENAVNEPEKKSFVNFNQNDGLSSREFVRRSAIISDDGWYYFGSYGGYTRFRPEEIAINQYKPKIVLTNFELIGGNGSTNLGSLFENGKIHVAREIELKYDQADFEIEFAALSYVNPKQNKYKYTLEGYDSKWHNAGTQRVATYTNIPPGNYFFRVKASNNDGVWSDEERVLEIRILPPWWKTILARFFFILTAAALAYMLVRIRFRLLENQNKVLEARVDERTSELTEANMELEEKQEEISQQNEELSQHRFHLEKLVEERTAEMKQAVQRAEEADMLKSAFLANMSHEIRTPMNAIVGFANMLSDDQATEEEKLEFAEIINGNVETLMVLINDILEISLIEANQIRLKNKLLNVTHILKELESFFQLKNDKNLEWEFVNKNEPDLMIITDSTRFRQVFVNLLNNANKYTEQGSIRFGYTKTGEKIQFFVTDTGIGIAEDEYNNIFNYFHKIDKGQNKLYRGAGIGLSISNKLVELMGGKIWVESEVGVGSSFYFTLPETRVSDTQLPKSEKERLSMNSLKDKTILVAEDESTNFILIERMLKSTQAKLEWARNGKEAVEFVSNLKDRSKCIILMDIKMPVLNGISAAAQIKEIDESIPIIAVTAYAHANDKHEILKHNFVDYMAKPVKAAVLIDKLLKNTKK